MRKAVVFSAIVLALASAGWTQNLPRFELGLYGGYGIRSLDVTSDYALDYNFLPGAFGILKNIGGSSNLSATSSGGIGLGGSLSFYLHPNLGLGFNFGYFRASIDAVTDSEMWWAWTYSTEPLYASDFIDPITMTGVDNYFQTIPLSLNFIARFGSERMQGYFSAGPTLFLNKILLQSEIAFPSSSGYAVDVARVPLELNQNWTSIGFDVGAGLTYWASSSFGIVLDARYYLSGKKQLDWIITDGDYPGLFDIFLIHFDSNNADYLYEEGMITSPSEINPSFLQISAGVKIRLH
jgi:opacity protein-like surface antigen